MIRGIWDRETVAVLLLISALPLAVAWLAFEGITALERFIFFAILAGIWHVIWMLARAQPPSLAGLLTAFALAMLAPQDLGLAALVISTSFGVVVAELAFGGWGRNILNPATVALAFMGFGFPSAPWPDLPVQLEWAAWAMAFTGILFGVIPPAIFLGGALSLILAMLAGVDLGGAQAAVWVVLVLVVCDPVASANLPLGRWLNGILYGGLVVLFACLWSGVAPVQLAVSAALFTSLGAPLCDEIALAIWLRRRKGRHG